MRILLTGSFGNIGKNVLRLLLEVGYTVRCLDVPTPRNRRALDSFTRRPWDARRIEVLWKDIRDPSVTAKAVQEVHGIIHLAAVLPPRSDRNPELAWEVNVGGTQNLIRAAEGCDSMPRFIFTSSISVYGPRMTDPPPRTATEDIRATDPYTSHKVECEGLLQQSRLPWTILRVAAASVENVTGGLDPILFRIPLDQRIEFIHSKDVARAGVNSLFASTVRRILLVGGGAGCQMLQRDFLRGIMEATGLGMLPESAFLVPEKDSDWYYTDYMDTQELQSLLHYQVITFSDYLEEIKRRLGWKRHLFRLLGPGVRFLVAVRSPFYRDHWRKALARPFTPVS